MTNQRENKFEYNGLEYVVRAAMLDGENWNIKIFKGTEEIKGVNATITDETYRDGLPNDDFVNVLMNEVKRVFTRGGI